MNIRLDSVMERDIDLLIMEEFVANDDFARIFLDSAGIIGDYVLKEVIHSKTDTSLGESDIVIIIENNGNRHALHIEDKIDAQAMPRQYERYVMRCEKDVAVGEYDAYSVLIVAPQKYLELNSEAKKYKYQVKYEKIREYFAANEDNRSKYKIALIDRAIIEQKNGYQWEANPGVVAFCTAMNAYKKTKYPGLPNGTVAWWSHYSTLINDAKIVFKANKGFCDLQFAQTNVQDLYDRIGKYLSEKMYITQANKSASVRIDVTPICLEDKFEEKIAEVDEALDAIWELYRLSQKLVNGDKNGLEVK